MVTASPASAHQIVVIGGGAAGLAVAARLMRLNNHLDVAVIEPAEFPSFISTNPAGPWWGAAFFPTPQPAAPWMARYRLG